MAILQRFDPPAYLPDFNAIPGQLEAWHRAVSNWFDSFIEEDRPLCFAESNCKFPLLREPNS